MVTKMYACLSAVVLLLTAQAFVGAQTTPPPPAPPLAADVPAVPPANPALKWESAIRKFEEADKKMPPQNAVLFVGSSSIVKWKSLAADFPNVPTINRGFGGSVISDSVYYADRIVVPYHPRRIVFYAGDNDLAGGKSPQTVADDFKAFVEKVRAALPDVPFVFIALKPSPSRWKNHVRVEEANRLIAAYCAQQKGLDFADIYPSMLGPDGQPIADLFVADKLHMNPKGYAIWTKLLTPYVR